MSDSQQPSKTSETIGGEEANDQLAPDAWPDGDRAPAINPASDPVVVGIGASAGGLDAFKQFLSAMPPDSNLAFVLIQHLDPHHESLMADLLSRTTNMQVVQAEDRMQVAPNCVYVIPPNSYIAISENVLSLREPQERRGARMAIDFFFRSLADDRREKAICVILSGTGSDGSLGLKNVKERGGLVVVQDPATAQYDGMPRNAILTDMVDYVVPIDEIPAVLSRYAQQFYMHAGDRLRLEQRVPADIVDAILSLVRVQTGRDFRSYKRSTIMRRLTRRMSLHEISSGTDYLQYLQENPDEIKRLLKDLLISVTNFFRDPDAFAALASQVIEPLVAAQPLDEPLRIWVPGCATGEEAYSLAILVVEQMSEQRKNFTVQIFATDIDEDALEVARAGVYPASIEADLSPERLQRFFTLDDQQYRVSKSLRDIVVFASQNLISDPPFSRIDLVSCRNLLIYLEPAIQREVLSLFHFALKDEGFLFLGIAETIGAREKLFRPISKKWRIYRQVAEAYRQPIGFSGQDKTVSAPQPTPAGEGPAGGRRSLSSTLQQRLLGIFAPTSAVIDSEYQCLYVHNPETIDPPLLQVPSGEPSQNFFDMLRHDLRTTVRTAILRARREQQEVHVTGIISHQGSKQSIVIRAEPFAAGGMADLLLLSFLREPDNAGEATGGNADAAEASNAVVAQLEQELLTTREDLQSTIQELETSNEELKASNEEVLSMNEELQSTNEELETSKEELQSLNEELATINSELQEKIAQLEAATNDLDNLLTSTNIATLFLDMQFAISRFTPATTELFNLLPGDLGRPISDITQRFSDPNLLDDADRVLRSLQPRMREVQTGPDRWYLRRILPYRTRDNRIDGVVITFTDISELKQAEVALRINEERFRTALAESPITVFQQDRDLRYTWVYNPIMPVEQILGRTDEELGFLPEEAARLTELKRQVLQTGEGIVAEIQVTVQGETSYFDLIAEPLYGLNNELLGITCASTDITERKRGEQERNDLLQREQEARVEAEKAVKVRNAFFSVAAHELKTPLTILQGNLQFMQRVMNRNDELSERSERSIRNVLKQTMRLNRLINMLLDVSRIEGKQLMISRDEMDLVDMLRQIVAEVRPELQNHTLSFDTAAEPVIILGDEARLEQVFYNLINNAVKYAPAGGAVDVHLWTDPASVYVTVRDEGIGIPEEDQAHIFENFFRSSNTEAARISGLGIGLFVVHEVITMHEGSIEVASEPGEGTTFTVRLPRLNS